MGIVVFLTPKAGANRWEYDLQEMKAAFTKHNTYLPAVLVTYDGIVIKIAGDSFVVVFAAPVAALTSTS